MGTHIIKNFSYLLLVFVLKTRRILHFPIYQENKITLWVHGLYIYKKVNI